MVFQLYGDGFQDITGLSNELLLCPTCCRFLPYEQFSIEHIIPQQAIAEDPFDVRAIIPKNIRSGTTLLCKKEILIKKNRIHGNGCNSWKGNYYDRFIKDVINPKNIGFKKFTSRHHIAMFNMCFLGLFEKFGYQVVLSQSGLIMRQQFFSQNKFNKNVPLKCQMILVGSNLAQYNLKADGYWRFPFKFNFEPNFCNVVIRSVSLFIPLTRNPETPIATQLKFAPSKYLFKPDFRTIFN